MNTLYHKTYKKQALSLSLLKDRKSGFTIVELLIVIVIIGILATISIVAYNNVNDKARASSAISALDQAKKKLELYEVENGGYPADLETIGIANTASVTYGYSATDANANFCLTATVGEISYYLNNSTKTSPTEGGCNGHVWPGGVVMTNLVTNGDFSQGTSGWSSENANTFAIVNGKIRLTGPTYVVIRILQFHALTQGHAYYVRVSGLARQSTSMSGYQFQYYDLPLSKAVFTNTVPAMTTESSYVFTVSTSVSPTTRFTVIGNGMTVGSPDYIEFGTASVIDLTATFGAGKEPTKAQMDQIMQQFPNGWFDGTVTANTKGVL